jgi:hypothetical protein
MFKKSIALLVLCLGIVSCAAPGAPLGANTEFNPLIGPTGSLVSSWQRRVEHGCADFSANNGAMTVRIAVDPARCDGGPRRSGIYCTTCGPGIFYQHDDSVVVQNYWPWSALDGIVFDSNGAATGMGPCPHSLSSEQLAQLRAVVSEVIARATTDAERSTLRRLDQILATTSGSSLGSAQYGCTLPVA